MIFIVLPIILLFCYFKVRVVYYLKRVHLEDDTSKEITVARNSSYKEAKENFKKMAEYKTKKKIDSLSKYNITKAFFTIDNVTHFYYIKIRIEII